MKLTKSPSGMFWVVLFNGIELERFDRKYLAVEFMAQVHRAHGI